MFFMKFYFPQWDADRDQNGSLFTEFTDKFFHAEKYFNVVKLDDNYEADGAYKDFRAFLTGHCNVYPVPFVTVHNLFQLHFAFFEQKVAIQFHLEKFSKPDKKVSEMQKMSTKMLKLEGWEILDLSEAEFKSWDYKDRIS
jgi:hypothetical protein